MRHESPCTRNNETWNADGNKDLTCLVVSHDEIKMNRWLVFQPNGDKFGKFLCILYLGKI